MSELLEQTNLKAKQAIINLKANRAMNFLRLIDEANLTGRRYQVLLSIYRGNHKKAHMCRDLKNMHDNVQPHDLKRLLELKYIKRRPTFDSYGRKDHLVSKGHYYDLTKVGRIVVEKVLEVTA